MHTRPKHIATIKPHHSGVTSLGRFLRADFLLHATFLLILNANRLDHPYLLEYQRFDTDIREYEKLLINYVLEFFNENHLKKNIN